MKKIKQILLFGNYNVGNIGDDSLLLASKKGLKKYFADYKMKVVAPKKPCDYLILPAGIKSFFRFSWLKTIWALKKSEMVVFGGGGLLNPEESRSLYIWGLQIYVAKFFKCKIAMLGQSFVPGQSSLVTKLLGKVDFITVRDSLSFRYVNRLHLSAPTRQTADLSFYNDLYNQTEEFEFDTDDFIVLNLRSYAKIDFEIIEQIFADLINYVTSYTTFSVYLMPFCQKDIKIYSFLKSKFKNNGRILVLPNEHEVLVSAIKKSKFVISERLHPLLFAIQLNKPVIALSYSSKVKGLLADLGLNNSVLDLDSETLRQQFAASLEQAFDASFEAESTDSASLKKKAEDNFRLLKMYLDGNSQ